MTKQELTENYTIGELADMVLKLQGKLDLLRTRCHEGTRDFYDRDMYGALYIVGLEELQKADFPLEPIDVASMLINATYTRGKSDWEKAIHKAFGNNSETITENIYSVNDLKEIAEHLLAYCDNNEVKE